MLWYKAWLETRARFLIGLALMMCAAAAIVLGYPKVVQLLPAVSTANLTGVIGSRIKEAAELERTYRGYIWYQWFRQNMAQIGTILAVLLGTGGLLQTAGSGALFTLSMPASRQRLIGVRAAAGLAEWLAIALVPQLVLTLFSPAIGQTFSLTDALVHGLCAFVAGAVFFSLAFLLSTEFSDLWRPLLTTLMVAAVVGSIEGFVRDLSPYGIFSVMNGEAYFRTGQLPWIGLLASLAASAALLYGAAINIARRDF